MFANFHARTLFGLLLGGTFAVPLIAQVSAQPQITPLDVPREMRQVVILHGKVALEDGTTLAEPIEIIRECPGMVRREAYTDAQGMFSITLDPNSTTKTGQGASEGGGTGDFGTKVGNWMSTTTRTLLWGCDLKAFVLGYRSTPVSLQGKDFTTPVDVGTIVLHRTDGVEGNSISVTSMAAPDDARKQYDKGRGDFAKQKLDSAEKHLKKATAIYPKYAAAWDLLGRVQRLQKQDMDAEKSFLASVKADDKYISPYLQLAGMSAGTGKWNDVLTYTAKVMSLDPANHPDAFFLNAIAHYNLRQVPEAETSVRKAVDTDKEHRFPRAELLLGNILRTKGDNAGAAEHLRNYIKLEPTSPEVPKIRIFLSQVESASNATNSRKRPD